MARRYQEAVERCRQAIELVPTHRGAYSYLFHSLMALGRRREAAEASRTLLEIEGAGPEIRERVPRSSEAAIEELRRYRLAVLEAGYAVYPLLDPLADDPRFQRMVEEVGIPRISAPISPR